MRKYVEFAKKSFHRNAAYKLQYYIGLFNAILTIFIGAAIWQAVYGDIQIIDGISKEQMVTYAVLGMIMRTMLSMNEFIIEGKVQTGEIAVDLLKPIKFLWYIFSIVLGDVLFNLWAKVIPVIIIAFFVFNLALPDESLYIFLFIISLILSYFVLYSLNMIFWLLAFWIHHIWSMITIKNSLIMLLSGATIPLWFLPKSISDVLYWLPFKDIYFTPLNIFLGKVTIREVGILYLHQLIWILILFSIGNIMWQKAQHKLIIQGG